MNGGWQDIAVTAAAVLALGWLIRQRIRARRKGCATCSLAEAVSRGPAADDAAEVRSARGPR